MNRNHLNSIRTVGILLAIMIFIARSLAFDFIADDAFISLRYLVNFLDGEGLVFNPGDRVEGYSNLLWILFLSVPIKLFSLDPLIAARIAGGIFGGGTVLLTALVAHQIQRRSSEPPSWSREIPPFLAAFAVASHPPLACWSIAGLETAFHTFLLLATVATILTDWQRPERAPRSLVLCGLLVLSRPEGILLGGALAAAAWVGAPNRTLKGGAARAGCFLAFALALHLFRWIYYHDVFPNTYYAKSSGGWISLTQGGLYLVHYLLDHGSAIVVPAAIIAGFFLRPRAAGALLGFTAVLQVLFILQAGGDGLPMYRFLVPIAPILALSVSLVLSRILCHRSATSGPSPLAIGAIAVAAAWVVQSSSDPKFASQYRLYRDQKESQVPNWTAAGKWLKENARPTDSIAAVAIGAIGYYSELITYDMLGLTDRHIARSEPPAWRKKLNQEQRWAGHEKQDGKYILSKRPTFLLLGNIAVTESPLDPSVPASQFIPYRTTSWIRVWEHDIVTHPDLDRLYQPRTVTLDNGRTFNFLQRRSEGE